MNIDFNNMAKQIGFAVDKEISGLDEILKNAFETLFNQGLEDALIVLNLSLMNMGIDGDTIDVVTKQVETSVNQGRSPSYF